MPHFSESMIHGPASVPAFVSPDIAGLASALSARVRAIAGRGGEATAVVYLSCPLPANPTSTRRSRADARLVPAGEPSYPAGTVFRGESGRFAVVTLGTFASSEGERMVEYVEVSAGAHGKILRVPEAEFAAVYPRWTHAAEQGSLPEDHPSRREVGY